MDFDEQELLIAVYGKAENETVRDVIGRIATQDIRCWNLLKKWKRKNLYTFDTDLDLGYLTDKGKATAQEHIRILEQPELVLRFLLSQLVLKALGWDSVESIAVHVEKATSEDDAPIAKVRLSVGASGKISHAFTVEQIRTIGINKLIKDFRHKVRYDLFGINRKTHRQAQP